MTTKRLFLISLALMLALVPAVAQAQDDLGALRAATARFHRVAEAEGAGYGQFLGCIASQDRGRWASTS